MNRHRSTILLKTSRALLPAIVIAGLTVPLVLPFFPRDFLVGHDGGVHETYAFLFDRALRHGQFPVRWVEGLAYGQGQPLFNFYQVGFYYLVSLIHAIGVHLSTAIKVTIALTWSAGTALAYLWLRPYGRVAGLIGAAVFAWSPYLMVDGYVRTAYPELMAVCLLPGLFFAIDGVFRERRARTICGLAVMTALLLVAHLPAALIAAPVAAAYAGGRWYIRRDPLPTLAAIGLGATLGVGLAAFYLLPALAELDLIRISTLTDGSFDFHGHFIQPAAWTNWSWGYAPSGSGEPHELSSQIGIVQWLAILAALPAALAIRRRPSLAATLAGWLVIVAGALIMTTAWSTSIWDHVRPLAFVQYPWRFLMLPTLACAAIAAICASLLPRRVQIGVLAIVIAVQWIVTANYRDQAMHRDRAIIQIDVEGWPGTMNSRGWGFREAAYDPIAVRTAPAPWPVRWLIADGTAHATVVREADTDLELLINTATPTRLTVLTPFFPGWTMTLDGEVVRPDVAADSGYMSLRVPSGSHRVRTQLRNTPARTAANAISAMSLLTMVVWLLAGPVSRAIKRN